MIDFNVIVATDAVFCIESFVGKLTGFVVSRTSFCCVDVAFARALFLRVVMIVSSSFITIRIDVRNARAHANRDGLLMNVLCFMRCRIA